MISLYKVGAILTNYVDRVLDATVRNDREHDKSITRIFTSQCTLRLPLTTPYSMSFDRRQLPHGSVSQPVSQVKCIQILCQYFGGTDGIQSMPEFVPIAEKLLGDGTIKVHLPKVLPGSLNGILGGLQMKEGRVSGEKLMYNGVQCYRKPVIILLFSNMRFFVIDIRDLMG